MTAAPPRRLFTALWPEPADGDRLARWAGRWHWPATARRVAPDRLHLTLHFMAAVPEDRVALLRQGLARCTVAPFRLDFGPAQVWPRGVAVLELAGLPPSLLALHAAQAEVLQALAIPVERRRYRPHLTLARHATGALPPDGPFTGHWQVSSAVLVESGAGEAGAYRILA